MSDTKKCPYCGEEIKTVAKKCKYCGEWLEEREISTPAPMQEHNLRQEIKPTKNGQIAVFLVIALAVILGVIIYFSLGKGGISLPSDVVSLDSLKVIKQLDSLKIEVERASNEVEKYANNHSLEDPNEISLVNFQKEEEAIAKREDLIAAYNALQDVRESIPSMRKLFGIEIGKECEDGIKTKYKEYINLLLEKMWKKRSLESLPNRPHSSLEHFEVLKADYYRLDKEMSEINKKLGLSDSEIQAEHLYRMKFRLKYLEDIMAGKIGTMEIQDHASSEIEEIKVILDIIG